MKDLFSIIESENTDAWLSEVLLLLDKRRVRVMKNLTDVHFIALTVL